MLSSFKRKAAMNFRLRNSSANRIDSPPSPKSFASPELHEIHYADAPPLPQRFHDPAEDVYHIGPTISIEPEVPKFEPTEEHFQYEATESVEGSEERESTEESEEVIVQRAPVPLPRVQLEIDTGPVEWFPPGFLNSDAFAFDSQSDTVNPGGGHTVEPTVGAHKDELPIANGTIDNNPEAIPNGQVDTVQSNDATPNLANNRGSESHAPSSFKISKSKIEIPNGMYHKSHMRLSSIPQSAISTDDMSSVSGTTLARALIGNSFVLSNDHRLSRNRTGLTRQDSTTLPRHSSTFWRDKRVSGREVVVDPDSSIPPVPPVPADLTSLRHKRSFAPEPSSSQIPVLTQQPRTSSPASNSRDSLGHGTPDEYQQQEIPESQSHPHPSMDLSSSEPNTPPIQAPSSSNHSVISLSASFTTAKTTSSKGSKSSRSGTTPPPLPLLTQPFAHHRTTSVPNSSVPLSVGVDSAFAGYEFATPVLSPGTSTVGPTSEESFSLSPYLSEADKDKVDPKKKVKGGISPGTSRGKVDWIFPRLGSAGRSESNQLLTASHLPIGDRPRSLLPSQAAPRNADKAPSPVQPSAPMTKRIGQLINAPFSPSRLGRQGIFNRQRSGSTPNPITVTRDSQDFNTYNISIGTAADVSPSTAGLSGNQTFPETPNAFSPMWSEGSVASPLRNEASEFLVVGNAAEITRSASFSGGSSSAPNLAQQILLTRAATTVRGTRAGLARPRIVPSTHPYANARNMSVLLTPPPEEPPDAESPTSTRIDDGTVDSVPAISPSHRELPVAGSVRSLQSDPSTPHSQGSSNPSEAVSLDSTIASPSLSPNAGADPLKMTSPGVNMTSNISSPGPGINIHGVRSTETLLLDTSLAIDKLLPPLPPITPENQTNEVSEVFTSAPPSLDPAQPDTLSASGIVQHDDATVATSPHPIRPFPSPPPPTRPIPSPPPTTQPAPPSPQAAVRSPRLLPQPKKPRPLPSQTPSPTSTASPPTEPPSSTPMRPRPFPPTPTTQSFMNTRPTNSLTLSLGAPPPYYSIVPVGANAISPFIGMDRKVTPSSSISSNGSNLVSSPSYSSSPPANTGHSATSTNSGASPHSSPRNRRDGKARPPLPMGPRKPVSTSSLQGVVTGNHVLDRNASVSSSGTSSRARAFSNASSTAPRFQIPPVKWRGYTIDAAKWTFTSAQLQGIVSRAIRQSAEASSLRLLQLETLDNELPDEMHRLEMQGMDVKSRYKVLSRKRWNLLASLSVVFDGVETGDPIAVLDELAEVSATLDQLAEELHSIDEQIGQLKSLRDIHSASALAMALRKLNSSFLKQLAETQKLRSQVEALEAERDEAWKQAEDVANEYDDLTENLRVIEAHSPVTPGSAKFSSSRRSSRVMAVRKSSIRVSKAGLRPPRSQRSSVSSIYRTSVASSSAVRSTFAPDNIPPVPPIPRPNPPGIVTADLQSRISMGISSGSPSSETNAMVKVQDEIYAMFGLLPESGTLLRRPRSFSVVGDSEPTQKPQRPISDQSSSCNRRSSFPGAGGIENLLANDRQAILTTLGLMTP